MSHIEVLYKNYSIPSSAASIPFLGAGAVFGFACLVTLLGCGAGFDSTAFGCGALRWNNFHGNECNEFWVYDVAEFSRRVSRSDFDPSCETFASKEAFCWNCRVIDETPEITHCKCLGHPTGDADPIDPRAIHYADTTYGAVRNHVESISVNIKQQVAQLAGPEVKVDGPVLSAGMIWDEYFECLPQHKEILDWILTFYWAHSKEPMTGFSVFRNVVTFSIPDKCSFVLWHASNNKPVAVKPDGGEYLEASRYLVSLEAGSYITREISNGICFVCSTKAQCADHAHALEIDGFPIPQSLRVTGFDTSLTSFGIERGRLPHMYKVGHDTSAHMLLLLHGASQLSLDGFGAHVLPSWVQEDQRDAILLDLCRLAERAEHRSCLSSAEVKLFENRFGLPLLGVGEV